MHGQLSTNLIFVDGREDQSTLIKAAAKTYDAFDCSFRRADVFLSEAKYISCLIVTAALHMPHRMFLCEYFEDRNERAVYSRSNCGRSVLLGCAVLVIQPVRCVLMALDLFNKHISLF
jgi:hypothetical protein